MTAPARKRKRAFTRDIKVAILDKVWHEMFQPRFDEAKSGINATLAKYIAAKCDTPAILEAGKELAKLTEKVWLHSAKHKGFVKIAQSVAINLYHDDPNKNGWREQLQVAFPRPRHNAKGNTPFSDAFMSGGASIPTEDVRYFSGALPLLEIEGRCSLEIAITDGNFKGQFERQAKAVETLRKEAEDFLKILTEAMSTKYVDDFVEAFPALAEYVPEEPAKSYAMVMVVDADKLNAMMKKFKPKNVNANA